MITESQLSEWQRLADEATPGPWFNDSLPTGPCGAVTYSNAVLGTLGQHIAERPAHEKRSTTYSDMCFIAASRTAVPALIAEVRRLRAEVTHSVAEEREACARLVDPPEGDCQTEQRQYMAAQIRARGAKEKP